MGLNRGFAPKPLNTSSNIELVLSIGLKRGILTTYGLRHKVNKKLIL